MVSDKWVRISKEEMDEIKKKVLPDAERIK